MPLPLTVFVWLVLTRSFRRADTSGLCTLTIASAVTAHALSCLQVADRRHGYVKGLRLWPLYRDMDNATFTAAIRDSFTGKEWREGFIPELLDSTRGGGVLGRGVPGVVWHALDVRYDQCVGSGEACLTCGELTLRAQFAAAFVAPPFDRESTVQSASAFRTLVVTSRISRSRCTSPASM
jgi:hypothetical protein